MIPEDTPVGVDNCGIATTAMLAGVPYVDAARLFTLCHGKHTLTTVWDRLDVLKKLGLTVLEERHYGKKPTLNRWLLDEYDPQFDYQVAMTGHVVVMRSHLLYDQVFRLGIAPLKSPYKRKHIHSHLVMKGL